MRIGIDVGGTKIAGGLVDDNGKVRAFEIINTRVNKGKHVIIRDIYDLITRLDDGSVELIGIGVPGLVDKSTGKIVFCPNIPCLKGVNLVKGLEKITRKDVFIDNDSNCFVLGEFLFGSAAGFKDVVGLIIGTGIGSGLILNGELYSGSSGRAGEFGHSFLKDTHKDFESLCSGPAIIKRYEALSGIKVKDASLVFKAHDRASRQVISETYQYLGMGVGWIVNILNPDLIVLGGGVSNSLNFNRLKKEVEKFSVMQTSHLKVERGILGDLAGVVGAAFLGQRLF